MSTQTVPTFHPSSDAAHRLAYLLKAIEDEKRNFKDISTAHRDTLQRLDTLVYNTRQEILTGQSSLLDVMEEFTKEVNAGALDTKDVKVRVKINKGKLEVQEKAAEAEEGEP